MPYEPTEKARAKAREGMRRYRERLKTDPGAAAKYSARRAAENKRYREQDRDKHRAQRREAKRRKRARLIADGTIVPRRLLTPEEKREKARAYARAYSRRPDVQERARERRAKVCQTEEFRARNLEYQRVFRKRHPERYREIHRPHRQARQRAKRAPGAVFYDRLDIYARDGGRCHLCKRLVPRQKFTIDHLIPVADGGIDAPWNVAIAHPRCNFSRGRGRVPAQLLLVG